MVSAGAFASPWVVQQFSNESHFVLGTVLFTGGLLVSLPVNYLAVKLALKPLRRLSLAMEELQRGNPGCRNRHQWLRRPPDRTAFRQL
ncbi:MAG: hypothetical protein ACYC0L_09505 [Thermoleophilia bacterium]